MKKTLLSRLSLLIPVLTLPSGAAEIIKLQNTTALNTGGAWNGGVAPASGDIMLWDATYTTPGAVGTLSQLGADMSVQGLKVTNVGGTANQATIMVGYQNTSSANTLTIGSAGINMSAATQALQLTSKILIGNNQTWAVANANTANSPATFNNGEDLIFGAQAAGVSMNLGANTVNVTGAGAVTITSGYTISNGTFNINSPYFLLQGGSNRTTTVNSDVTMNVPTGGVLVMQANSGPTGGPSMVSNGTVNLTGGILRLASNNAGFAVNMGGTVNVNSASTLNIGKPLTNTGAAGAINVSSNIAGSAALNFLNDVGTAPVVTLSGDNSGYSGTITFNGTSGRVTRMATATAGSAAATWSIPTGQTLSLNAVGVNFGTLNGAGSISTYTAGASTATVGAGNFTGTLTNGTGTLGLTKNTTGTLTLTGANTYTGPTQVNAGTLITTPLQTGGGSVDIAAVGTLSVKLSTLGTTFNASALTTAASGATIHFDNGALANPTAPLINASAFAPAAGTVLKLTGTGYTAGLFTLVDYNTLGGGGFGALSVNLPYRLAASLVDNTGGTSVDLNVFGNDTPKWMGNVSAAWDVDDGTPTGTQNWKTAFTNTATRYLQNSPNGTDSVIFDDTAAGNFNVNLTTTLTPQSVAVNNSVNSYTFSGTGKLSGTGGIVKTGGGTLIIANTTANDYSGGTQINAGTVQVGDGVTAGAGSLGSGPVVVNSTLDVNRQGGLSIPGAVSGTGSIVLNKNLTTTGGGSFSGVISGPGNFTNSGGNLQLAGTAANTWAGTTTITAGQLQLNKTAGVNAVPGDITISGSGQLVIQAGEQIPDSATINFIGTSTDSIPTQAAVDTVANVIVNSSTSGSAGGQVILKNGLTISGTGTVNSGVLGVASGQTGNVAGINITSAPGSAAIVRIAGSTGASVLNVGAGGITASGGEIQVKFNTGLFDATLNLGGNFTATGNVIFTNGGFTGANANVINLTATRTFDIAAGTTTTVAPDFGGPGGLTKTGNGILALTTTSNAAHTGITTISQGTLSLAGAASISLSPKIIVQAGATFDVSAASPAFSLAAGQTLGGKGTITGPITLNASSVLAPGESPGTLTFNGNLDITNAVAGSATGSLVFELATPGTSDQVLLGPTATLTIGAGGLEFDDFSFSALGGFGPGTYVLFDTSQPISTTLGPNVTGTVGGYGATLEIGGTNDLVLTVVGPEPGSAALGLAGLLLLTRRRR